MMDKMSLMAVFAHPDDESCGPGATLAMYAHRGVEVALVCLTRGERGAWGADQDIPLEEFGGIRVRGLANACSALGVRRWTVLRYPDGEVSRYGTGVLVQDILLRVWKARPQVMITHWPEGSEGHPGHDAVAREATEAFEHSADSRFCRYIPDCPPYEPLKLYYADPPDPEPAEKPSVQGSRAVVNASSFAETKARALLCHESQEECWQERIRTLRRAPHWTESFWLARSKVPADQGPENDLFAGVIELEPHQTGQGKG